MALRIIIALGIVGMGFVIFPYYNDFVLTPIIDLINSMYPAMNVWQDTFITLIPFAAFLMIIFFGVMHLLGKISSQL